jgi:hypothetical protein
MCSLASPAEPPEQFKGWVYFEENNRSPHFQILDNQEDLEQFRKRIPKQIPSKKKPAPPNEDPLLESGRIDFQKNILLVVTRGQTLSAYPVLENIEESEEQVVLLFDLPEPPPESRPYGWGTYRAVLLPVQNKQYKVKFDQGS